MVMDWQDTGAVKLLAGLKVAGLRAPFKGAASVRDMNVNPDINTRVEDVGINFGFQVGDFLDEYICQERVEFPVRDLVIPELPQRQPRPMCLQQLGVCQADGGVQHSGLITAGQPPHTGRTRVISAHVPRVQQPDGAGDLLAAGTGSRCQETTGASSHRPEHQRVTHRT